MTRVHFLELLLQGNQAVGPFLPVVAGLASAVRGGTTRDSAGFDTGGFCKPSDGGIVCANAAASTHFTAGRSDGRTLPLRVA